VEVGFLTHNRGHFLFPPVIVSRKGGGIPLFGRTEFFFVANLFPKLFYIKGPLLPPPFAGFPHEGGYCVRNFPGNCLFFLCSNMGESDACFLNGMLLLPWGLVEVSQAVLSFLWRLEIFFLPSPFSSNSRSNEAWVLKSVFVVL